MRVLLIAVNVSLSSLYVACLAPDPSPGKSMGDTSPTLASDSAADAASDAAPPVEVTPDTSGAPDASDGGSPVTLSVREGDEVIPQTMLHLGATWIGSDDDPVVAWRWTAIQPDGSVSLFIPSASVADPTFEANVAGEYVFWAELTTASGRTARRAMRVLVVPDEVMHVELIWRTPGDEDETDTRTSEAFRSAGSDVDLHFARRVDAGFDHDGDGRPDAWFGDGDCFWNNARPSWGDTSMEQRPRLDRDDTDGAGPENINFDDPDACFDIAVHYWDDWSYGPADITLRIYLYGSLAEARVTPALVKGQLWLVGALCMGAVPTFEPATRCTADGCGSWIVPDYVMPEPYVITPR